MNDAIRFISVLPPLLLFPNPLLLPSPFLLSPSFLPHSPSEHTAIDVCFAQELRKALPSRSLFRKKIVTGMTLKTDDRERIFKLAAQPSAFYKVIVQLQVVCV